MATSSSCLPSANLDSDIVSAWSALDPSECTNPNTQSGPSGSTDDGCQPFYSFISNYGTHVITSFSTGARLDVFYATSSSNDYSQSNLTANACASYSSGLSSSISACASYSSEQLESALQLTVQSSTTILGGSGTAKVDLISNSANLNTTLVNAFLQSGVNSTSAAIGYSLTALWDLLVTALPGDSEASAKADVFSNLLSTGFLVDPDQPGESSKVAGWA